jgi:ACS family tartrate transporter-like MFS transporter
VVTDSGRHSCGHWRYFLLPSRPTEAKFLTPQERNLLTAELNVQEQGKVSQDRITVGQTLAHRRVWHLTVAYFAWAVGQYTMIFWMPQLVKTSSSQYSNTTIGILVMIPYIAALFAMIFVAYRSDRTLERRYHAAIPVMIAGAALVLLGATASPAFVSVIFWCFAAAGVYSLLPPFWSIPNEFLSGFSAAAGIAFINSFGNIGGFVGAYGMGAINRRTGSFHGGLVCAGFSLFASAMLMLALRKRTQRQAASSPVTEQQVSVVMPTAEAD